MSSSLPRLLKEFPASRSGRVVSRLRSRDLVMVGGDEGGVDKGSIESEVVGEIMALELGLSGLKNDSIDPRFAGAGSGSLGISGS